MIGLVCCAACPGLVIRHRNRWGSGQIGSGAAAALVRLDPPQAGPGAWIGAPGKVRVFPDPAALGKPVVAMFGDSPVARWRPWGVAHRVVRPESGDLADLQLEPVLDATAALAVPNVE